MSIFQSTEVPLESPLRALSETPLRALNTANMQPDQPCITISTVSSVIPLWYSAVPVTQPDGSLLEVVNGNHILSLGGVFEPGLILTCGQGGCNIIGTQDQVIGVYPFTTWGITLPDFTWPPPTSEIFNSLPFEAAQLFYPYGPWPNGGEVIIPAGSISDQWNQTALNLEFNTLTLSEPNDNQANPPGSPTVVNGFAVYPAGQEACLVFCPMKIPGTVSYHTIVSPGILSAPVSSIEINPESIGTPDDPNWCYLCGALGEWGFFAYCSPGPGPERADVGAINANPGGNVYPASAPPTAVLIWPTVYNYGTTTGQVICLWINLKPSELPTAPFNPATYNLLVCK